MPPKRSTSKPANQPTLAFHGASSRITKPGAAKTLDEKASKYFPLKSGTRKVSPKHSQSPTLEPKKEEQEESSEIPVDDVVLPPTTAEIAIAEQAQDAKAAVLRTPEEEEASKVKQVQINKYWKAKEQERKAPRVHQEGLGVHEKILREWDTSAQYGPCIGIARLKRWKRAHRLGLNPPIEVLAVLLKDEDKDGIQRSQVDELMSSRFDH